MNTIYLGITIGLLLTGFQLLDLCNRRYKGDCIMVSEQNVTMQNSKSDEQD